MIGSVDEIETYETHEAIIHRDADKLECLFQAIEYQETGNTNMQTFVDSMLAACLHRPPSTSPARRQEQLATLAVCPLSVTATYGPPTT